jgi:hypothetical protein
METKVVAQQSGSFLSAAFLSPIMRTIRSRAFMGAMLVGAAVGGAAASTRTEGENQGPVAATVQPYQPELVSVELNFPDKSSQSVGVFLTLNHGTGSRELALCPAAVLKMNTDENGQKIGAILSEEPAVRDGVDGKVHGKIFQVVFMRHDDSLREGMIEAALHQSSTDKTVLRTNVLNSRAPWLQTSAALVRITRGGEVIAEEYTKFTPGSVFFVDLFVPNIRNGEDKPMTREAFEAILANRTTLREVQYATAGVGLAIGKESIMIADDVIESARNALRQEGRITAEGKIEQHDDSNVNRVIRNVIQIDKMSDGAVASGIRTEWIDRIIGIVKRQVESREALDYAVQSGDTKAILTEYLRPLQQDLKSIGVEGTIEDVATLTSDTSIHQEARDAFMNMGAGVSFLFVQAKGEAGASTAQQEQKAHELIRQNSNRYGRALTRVTNTPYYKIDPIEVISSIRNRGSVQVNFGVNEVIVYGRNEIMLPAFFSPAPVTDADFAKVTKATIDPHADAVLEHQQTIAKLLDANLDRTELRAAVDTLVKDIQDLEKDSDAAQQELLSIIGREERATAKISTSSQEFNVHLRAAVEHSLKNPTRVSNTNENLAQGDYSAAAKHFLMTQAKNPPAQALMLKYLGYGFSRVLGGAGFQWQPELIIDISDARAASAHAREVLTTRPSKPTALLEEVAEGLGGVEIPIPDDGFLNEMSQPKLVSLLRAWQARIEQLKSLQEILQTKKDATTQYYGNVQTAFKQLVEKQDALSSRVDISDVNKQRIQRLLIPTHPLGLIKIREYVGSGEIFRAADVFLIGRSADDAIFLIRYMPWAFKIYNDLGLPAFEVTFN